MLRDGRVANATIVNGHPQRRFQPHDEMASPFLETITFSSRGGSYATDSSGGLLFQFYGWFNGRSVDCGAERARRRESLADSLQFRSGRQLFIALTARNSLCRSLRLIAAGAGAVCAAAGAEIGLFQIMFRSVLFSSFRGRSAFARLVRHAWLQCNGRRFKSVPAFCCAGGRPPRNLGRGLDSMLEHFAKPEDGQRRGESARSGIEDRSRLRQMYASAFWWMVCMDGRTPLAQTRKDVKLRAARDASVIGTGMESSPRGCR